LLAPTWQDLNGTFTVWQGAEGQRKMTGQPSSDAGITLGALPAKSASGNFFLRPGSRGPDGDEFDAILLQQTQAYLECCSLRLKPNSKLLAAWERFYQIYDPLIRRFVAAFRVLEDSRDDCVQQVWTELVRKLRGFRYDARRGLFRSWLYRITHSKAVDLHRHRVTHHTETLNHHAAVLLPGRESDPAAECERQGQREMVRQVLAELRCQVSKCSYQVLHQRWIEGRTVAETAAGLGLTSAQVWYREHRLKRRLSRLFKRYMKDARPSAG
jgi:RNA polymerase sigma-70 factor (ECF subfamily)